MERLRELRARKNLLQREVAESLNIDRTTYAKYETGDSEPSYEILKRIARFYGVSTDYLLDFETESQKTIKKPSFTISEEEKRLILDYRGFNEKGKSKIREEIYTMTLAGIYKNPDDLPDLGKIGGKK